MNLRSCDLCAQVKPMTALWWFVTEGRGEPSEWRLAEHWCADCIKAIRELMAEVTGVRHVR